MKKLSFSGVQIKLFPKISKYFTVALFVFFTFFNINLLLENNGWGIKLVNEVFALPENDEGGGTGGGGGSTQQPTRFFNYGTWTETKYCQKTTVGFFGIEIEYYWASVYWLMEYCLYGGNSVECIYGTVRKTYQGGGC